MAVSSKDKKSGRNRRRVSAPKTAYSHAARPLRLGDERFRLTVFHGSRDSTGEPITDVVSSFQWDDTSAEITGQMTLTADTTTRDVRISQEDRIRCEWSPQLSGSFTRLWTMKVATPQVQLQAASWQLDLDTSLTEARRSRDDYKFKRDKTHPHGWTADQVARAVAKRVGLPLGRVARCHHRIVNLVRKDADPLDMITLAYRAERRATGRRFFMSWDGRVNIDPLARSTHLLELASVLVDASYQAELSDTFATALTVTATAKAADDKDKTGKDRKTKHRKRKILVRVTSPQGIRQYGYVHRAVTASNATTEHAARTYGRHVLAKAMKPKRTLTVTTPIMPFIRRGDAFTIDWAAEGLTQTVWVAQVSHSASPGDMTSQITATFDDPYADPQKAKDAAKRKAKAKQRGRTSETGGAEAPTGGTSSRSKRRR